MGAEKCRPIEGFSGHPFKRKTDHVIRLTLLPAREAGGRFATGCGRTAGSRCWPLGGIRMMMVVCPSL